MLDSSTAKVLSQPASLSPDRIVCAHEVKFLLPNSVADQLLDYVRPELPADPPQGDDYRVSSLYFDTPTLDTYRRTKGYRRRKFRVRRYEGDSQVALERKAKSKGEVKTRCTTISEDELPMLLGPQPSEQWPGYWYHKQLVKRGIAPLVNLSYQRVARAGMTPEGPIRFLVDRQMRCGRAAGLSLPTLTDDTTFLDGQSIVEFKFHVALPALFKELMYEFSLTPARVSKFRLSIEACGLVAQSRAIVPIAPQQEQLRTIVLPKEPAACRIG